MYLLRENSFTWLLILPLLLECCSIVFRLIATAFSVFYKLICGLWNLNAFNEFVDCL